MIPYSDERSKLGIYIAGKRWLIEKQMGVMIVFQLHS
jgi:hypothetical protein